MIFTPLKIADQTEVRRYQVLDDQFFKLSQGLLTVPQIIRTFADATGAALGYSLPDGNTNGDKDYYFQKIDVSANAVTITSMSPQTINGAATKILGAQFDKAHLVWNRATQQWYIV